MKTVLHACCFMLAVGLHMAWASATTPNASAQVHALKVTILSTMLADKGIGEWGFAALVEVDGHKILFDTGAHPNTVLDNARDLKIDLSDVQDVVLSHFHPDHTGGLMTLRRELSRINPAAMSRVHVGAGIFLPRRTPAHGSNKMIAIKQEFEASGGSFIVHDKPDEILPGVWLSGPVPRASREKNYQAEVEVEIDGKWIEDYVPEDQSLIFNSEQGLVVLSGCGHSGIVNTLEYTRKFLQPQRVQAIIGGLHTNEATEETLAWTAGKLKQFQVAQILGAHCTGIESVYRLRELMGLTRKTCVVATIGAIFELAQGITTGSIVG